MLSLRMFYFFVVGVSFYCNTLLNIVSRYYNSLWWRFFKDLNGEAVAVCFNAWMRLLATNAKASAVDHHGILKWDGNNLSVLVTRIAPVSGT